MHLLSIAKTKVAHFANLTFKTAAQVYNLDHSAIW